MRLSFPCEKNPGLFSIFFFFGLPLGIPFPRDTKSQLRKKAAPGQKDKINHGAYCVLGTGLNALYQRSQSLPQTTL